jgi:hypothetical protein
MSGPRVGVLLLAVLLFCASGARAQVTVHTNENLDSNRTEAWAMKYFAASSLMTMFGETPALAPWRWGVAGDLGYIPKLSEMEQRVGLHGVKHEDLNRSPVFGRLRILLGLPGEFVATLGYTPPVTIAGTKARDLFALAIARRLYDRDDFSVSMQFFGEHGRAQGDVTCPKRLAGNPDLEQNPYGCQAPSNDTIKLNYYGLEVTTAWTNDSWHAHLSAGAVRTEFAVQVDAYTFGVHDRSLVVSRGSMPFYTAGVSKDLDAHWNLGAEVLYVPLYVQRVPDTPSQNDSLTSVRLQLLYRFD